MRERFAAEHPYPFDRFQTRALDLLDEDMSVVVSAPTGSGKTVVAEYAVRLALEQGRRAFYTTPIKALSNQKYGDLRRRHGADQVGLLTGDNSINPEAPVVVMTTEVLRNMIHAQPSRLSDLKYAVLDEVHYLQDRYRGGVWEEVILGAPESVRLVCLSATVANAEEFADWVGSVRGATGVVLEARRPVELRHLFAIGDRSSEGLHLLPTFVDGRPNPEAQALDEMMAVRPGRQAAGRPGGSRPLRGGARPHRPRVYRPRRSEVAERLAEEKLLPAIYFIFSRAGCDDAVRHCMEDGIRLTTPEERSRIRAIVDSYVDPLSDDDLSVLGYERFAAALEAGLAPHHAGMVPPFREAVEACFTEALVKVVFATETLALGINMPARAVVIEEVSKYGGGGHEELTSGEYTQLTGRAGRRGIDEIGYAVALCSPFHRFSDVARIAGNRPRALTSSFRPTYNMAVNLVRRLSREDAYRLVGSSFAQFLTDADLTGQLDAVVELLTERGYLEGWHVTKAGRLLSGIYHEADLLIAESLGAGLLDGLDFASMAAVASAFCFETRRERDVVPSPPSAEVASRLDAISDLSASLVARERLARLPATRGIDAGFAGVVHDWARGRDLADVLSPKRRGTRDRRPPPSMSGGDFVRNVRQVLDLLRQLAVVAELPETATSARVGASRLLRDVVLASSAVTIPLERGTIRVAPGAAP